MAKCPYCDFNSHIAKSIDTDSWQKAMLDELDYMASQVSRSLSISSRQIELKSIFFGGGTPSLMPPRIAADIIDRTADLFKIADKIEVTAEMNPTSVETQKLSAFSDAGINRVSVGIQSLDEAGLEFLGREHNAKEALSALEAAKKYFPLISADLIYGIPHQTKGNWRCQLNRLLDFELEHLSCYQLTIEAGTVFHSRAQQGDILINAADDEVAQLYILTEELLSALVFMPMKFQIMQTWAGLYT